MATKMPLQQQQQARFPVITKSADPLHHQNSECPRRICLRNTRGTTRTNSLATPARSIPKQPRSKFTTTTVTTTRLSPPLSPLLSRLQILDPRGLYQHHASPTSQSFLSSLLPLNQNHTPHSHHRHRDEHPQARHHPPPAPGRPPRGPLPRISLAPPQGVRRGLPHCHTNHARQTRTLRRLPDLPRQRTLHRRGPPRPLSPRVPLPTRHRPRLRPHDLRAVLAGLEAPARRRGSVATAELPGVPVRAGLQAVPVGAGGVSRVGGVVDGRGQHEAKVRVEGDQAAGSQELVSLAGAGGDAEDDTRGGV